MSWYRMAWLGLGLWLSFGGSAQGEWFYGGSVSAGFGTVDYVEVAPMVGTRVTPRLDAGVNLVYRHRRDERASETLTTNDYGGALFGRYGVTPPFFLQAEYEYLRYERFRADLTKERDTFTGLFGGGGLAQPLSNRATAYATVLYNFAHQKDDSPYDDPWRVRVAVSLGF